jgi:hypothetical protein
MSERQFRSLPALDDLTDMGYTLKQFSHVDTRELFYARPDQVVGRQLVTLERTQEVLCQK